ncbi:putative ATPase domain protein [Caulobacter phage CcrColossus]|uniref:Putative ATPase domain protein n=1 Tax=Caulobacter phage CcrColossus TaxID=1211640 RepID=K4JRI9_9CAUD|nr:putative ATPase domain protein [Caulobacter phage CcrColossus]AFU87919.1 putative ATPase domain protein [Caulobacter phage CcrColossus]
MTDVPTKRPITVTVTSTEPGAGKTTLIALIGHALHNTGHSVKVPPQSAGPLHTRSLEEFFDVTFLESEGPIYTPRQLEWEIARRVDDMKAAHDAKIAEFRQANIELLKRLEDQRHEIEATIVKRTEAMRQSYEQRLEAMSAETHELRRAESFASNDAQQARNALAETAIIIAGLHQDRRLQKG